MDYIVDGMLIEATDKKDDKILIFAYREEALKRKKEREEGERNV